MASQGFSWPPITVSHHTRHSHKSFHLKSSRARGVDDHKNLQRVDVSASTENNNDYGGVFRVYPRSAADVYGARMRFALSLLSSSTRLKRVAELVGSYRSSNKPTVSTFEYGLISQVIM